MPRLLSGWIAPAVADVWQAAAEGGVVPPPLAAHLRRHHRRQLLQQQLVADPAASAPSSDPDAYMYPPTPPPAPPPPPGEKGSWLWRALAGGNIGVFIGVIAVSLCLVLALIYLWGKCMSRRDEANDAELAPPGGQGGPPGGATAPSKLQVIILQPDSTYIFGAKEDSTDYGAEAGGGSGSGSSTYGWVEVPLDGVSGNTAAASGAAAAGSPAALPGQQQQQVQLAGMPSGMQHAPSSSSSRPAPALQTGTAAAPMPRWLRAITFIAD